MIQPTTLTVISGASTSVTTERTGTAEIAVTLDRIQILDVLEAAIGPTTQLSNNTGIEVTLSHYVGIGYDLNGVQHILVTRIPVDQSILALDLLTILIIQRYSTGHYAYSITRLAVTSTEVTTSGTPEVVVSRERLIGTTTVNGNGSIVSIRKDSLVSVANQLRTDLRYEVALVSQRRELTNLTRVAELDPLSLVATVDVVVARQLGTVESSVLHLQVADSGVIPLSNLSVNYVLIVVVERSTTGLESLSQDHVTVILSQSVPRESLDSVADTGQSPLLALDCLVDHIFKVHTLIPVGHTPLLTTGIRRTGISVTGVAAVTSHHTSVVVGNVGSIPVDALELLDNTSQVEVRVYMCGSILINIDIEPLLAAGESHRCQHQNTCKYLFHIYYTYLMFVIMSLRK